MVRHKTCYFIACSIKFGSCRLRIIHTSICLEVMPLTHSCTYHLVSRYISIRCCKYLSVGRSLSIIFIFSPIIGFKRCNSCIITQKFICKGYIIAISFDIVSCPEEIAFISCTSYPLCFKSGSACLESIWQFIILIVILIKPTFHLITRPYASFIFRQYGSWIYPSSQILCRNSCKSRVTCQ